MADTFDPQNPSGNKDFDLLIKLLNMTTSDNDNIALMAVRKANAHLDKFRWSWESLLQGRVKIAADPFSGIAAPQAAAQPARRTGTPAAPAQPAASRQYYTPPPPPPPPPSSASSAYQPFAVGKSNRFETGCHLCLARIPAGKGILHSKTGPKWKVECGPGWGCKAKRTTKAQKAQQKASVDSIADSLGLDT